MKSDLMSSFSIVIIPLVLLVALSVGAMHRSETINPHSAKAFTCSVSCTLNPGNWF